MSTSILNQPQDLLSLEAYAQASIPSESKTNSSQHEETPANRRDPDTPILIGGDARLPFEKLTALADMAEQRNSKYAQWVSACRRKHATEEQGHEASEVNMTGIENNNQNTEQNMSFATSAPGQSAGELDDSPPICGNCETSRTPLWRRDEDGNVLCNACGLFLKLHGRPRPISLKTNVIKSRNRVKTTTASNGEQKKKGPFPGPGLSASHPDLSQPAPSRQNPQQRQSENGLNQEEQISSTDSPNAIQNAQQSLSNIAPQHMFDSMTLDPSNQHPLSNFYQPPEPYMSQRGQSPSTLGNGVGGADGSQSDLPQSYNELVAANTSLKTRVSELEVINNLFRERVAELEGSLEEARRREQALRERVGENDGTDNGVDDDAERSAKRVRTTAPEENEEMIATGEDAFDTSLERAGSEI